ncbi:5-amino-6-(D-ribitylamino)uracil--L-tyrosine 4-hydroxyphenyl transferase CofH [Marinibaculum pumilum]|uniref:FO synthase n=1 Tax=Marinibaculum pumilum TaxID=1766165 RepID=A0ABV7KZR1_9PROT
MSDLPIEAWISRLTSGGRLQPDELEALAGRAPLPALLVGAAAIRDAGHGANISVSRKVFVPLTQLCRDVCAYCTFAHPPKAGEAVYLDREAVLEIARAGARAGCDEVLFTLGDKPEVRYRAAREALDALGHASTLDYLHEMAAAVLQETGLLPHINAGVMTEADIARLRGVSASQGLMLETGSDRLSARGGPHWGSPDKQPAARLATIAAAGRARVPFTSGILIGIGESRAERLASLLALRDLHDAHGHIQEVIVQNFRAKPGTRMAGAAEPDLEEQLWTIALARFVFGPAMSIQAPPNLRAEGLAALIGAGINDWGGVSPVTPDHVNPEAPWPALSRLAAETAASGKTLVPRLTVYPAYLQRAEAWLDPAVRSAAIARADTEGFAHETGWRVGHGREIVPLETGMPALPRDTALSAAIDRAMAGRALEEAEIVTLFRARGPAAAAVRDAADALRAERVGGTVGYVVTRNINYTNVCGYRCRFCAFSKGRLAENLRGRPYDLTLEEIQRRTVEAWQRGGTEVCMQGGIHPDYTGETYLEIVRAVKAAVPEMHVHAFSPLEVTQGARTLGLSVAEFLSALKEAGLGSLPGTAAEILDDEVRARLCPDKIRTDAWLEVVETAHLVGLRTTATIMFGHIERYVHWARHLLRLRRLQERTGGLTELVPLPFVHMEAPIYLSGDGARQGPSLREAIAMHAVARLALNPVLPNIQASWVKLGEAGLAAAMRSGANDLGGTLMDESISRAAGADHGQELPPQRMIEIARGLGRMPRQRSTLYGDVPDRQCERALQAPPLTAVVNAPAGRHARTGGAQARGAGGAGGLGGGD